MSTRPSSPGRLASSLPVSGQLVPGQLVSGRPVSGRQIKARFVRVMAVAALVVVAGLGSATTASAHSQLERTDPADGAQLATLPEAITLTFNQNVLGVGTAVEVTGPAGSVIDGAPTVVDQTVRQAIRPGSAAGDYTVLWRVTSADGHPVSGQFTFSAAAGSSGTDPAATSTAAQVSGGATGGNSALIWLLLAFAALLVAGVALARRTNSAARAEPTGEGDSQSEDAETS